MVTKTILIIGASGLVGSVFANYASKNYDLYLINNTKNFSLQKGKKNHYRLGI